MGSYVLAVSGGVDSVVLLDALAKHRTVATINPWRHLQLGKLIVAHFDHGIREDSSDDEQFVRHLAEEYGADYRSKREELGADASEDMARTRRYRFFTEVCSEFDATLVTAHHVNDIAESIAINSTRGTGWRGVAVMDSPLVTRPLLGVTKKEIIAYAGEYGLTWHEDSTNQSDAYLRNRIRKKLNNMDTIWQLAALRARQCELKRDITTEALRMAGSSPYSRYFFSHCGDVVGLELLRTIFVRDTGVSPLPAARARALHAIKTAKPHTTMQVGDGVKLRFTAREFVVERGL